MEEHVLLSASVQIGSLILCLIPVLPPLSSSPLHSASSAIHEISTDSTGYEEGRLVKGRGPMAHRAPLLALPEALQQELYGSFRNNFFTFVHNQGSEVPLPLPSVRCWLVALPDGAFLHLYEEEADESHASCDQCRIIGEFVQARRSPLLHRGTWGCESLPSFHGVPAGWGNHPVSRKRYHFIVPAEVSARGRSVGSVVACIGSSCSSLPSDQPACCHQPGRHTFLFLQDNKSFCAFGLCLAGGAGFSQGPHLPGGVCGGPQPRPGCDRGRGRGSRRTPSP